MIGLLLAAAVATAPCAATGTLAPTICGDPALRKADAILTQREAVLAAGSPMKASRAYRAKLFRTLLARGEDDYDGKPPHPFDAQGLLDNYEERTKEVNQFILWDQGVSRTDPTQRFTRACLSTVMRGCRVEAAGYLNGHDGKTRILWQIQSGATDSDGVGGGIILWDASRPGAPTLIGWSFEGYSYDAPKLNMEDGQLILWAAGTRAGTAEDNADLLFVRRGGKWVEVETWSWRNALPARLPKGYGVWKGIDYTLTNLFGWSDLWRDKDANCCATGGRAYFDFGIEGTSLVLKDVDIQLVDENRKQTEGR